MVVGRGLGKALKLSFPSSETTLEVVDSLLKSGGKPHKLIAGKKDGE